MQYSNEAKDCFSGKIPYQLLHELSVEDSLVLRLSTHARFFFENRV